METIDYQVLEALIGIYNENEEQIALNGENTALLTRREFVRKSIVDYAKRFCPLLKDADEMSVEQIANLISDNEQKRSI